MSEGIRFKVNGVWRKVKGSMLNNYSNFVYLFLPIKRDDSAILKNCSVPLEPFAISHFLSIYDLNEPNDQNLSNNQ